MNDIWCWKLGSQKTGYKVLTLFFSRWLEADVYIIKYPQGSFIPPHIDYVGSEREHYRLNIEVWPAKEGGELVCSESIFRWGPINLFRPDKVEHSVTEVKQGIRYVFSIGWLRKPKA